MIHFLVYLCFVALHLTLTSAETSPFDGETLVDTSNVQGEQKIPPVDWKNKYEMPPSCGTDNFCFEKGDNYPEETINKILHRLPIPSSDGRIEEDSYDDSELDCPHDDSFSDKPIYYIRDEKDQVRVVVQSEDKFPQIYSVKWCKRPGLITYDTPHFLANSALLEKYKIECVNTTMNFDFLVLSATEGRVEMARPKGGLPVCCKCRYTKPN